MLKSRYDKNDEHQTKPDKIGVRLTWRKAGEEMKSRTISWLLFIGFIFVALTLSSCTRIPPQPPPRDYDRVYKYQRDAVCQASIEVLLGLE